ncbi:MAG: UDP-N-acetylmuramoyl-L-alanine--D-glutamate ligase [Acidobacteria bacterium]|nr:UDP-N-acetylmuramoyl-L-alanine--D-glutamate ligase [Acidobacteriota bacterium]
MKQVVVLGAGRSGVAAAKFLAAHEVDVRLTDASTRDQLPYAVDLPESIETFFGSHPLSLLDGTDLIILSPGIPKNVPFLLDAEDRGIEIISEIELAYRHLQGTVIAVTGSNGKSTTTSLIGHILSVAGLDPIVAGNIGAPLISAVDPGHKRTYVVELSSFQLESIDRFRANVAVLLNITPDHMDRYDSLEAYASAKYQIFRNQEPSDVAVVNADDERTARPDTDAPVLHFSTRRSVGRGAWRDGTLLRYSVDGQERTIERSSLAIEGDANVENALAAWLAAASAGAGHEQIEEAFRTFRGLPHRMELVATIGGVRWINDSKGTNVDATRKSLEGAEGRSVILILGGKDKGGEFHRLRDLVETRVKLLITIGSAAPVIEEQLGGIVETIGAGTMDRAVRAAHEKAGEGDLVLLSPACASFDQYRNFEERGEHFETLVGELETRR